MRSNIVLCAINAKWIHPSLALRLLKANLGNLEPSCEIIEFALRQPLSEKTNPILEARPRILGISVSIWNHGATIELLDALEKEWSACNTGTETSRPVIVLGGPEVSHLPPDAEIFRFADYVIRGDGEHEFKKLCDSILSGNKSPTDNFTPKPVIISAAPADVNTAASAYHLYSDQDLTKKLTYVESSRGCPFHCEFCQSAIETDSAYQNTAGKNPVINQNKVRYFPVDKFLAEMDDLISRGARTFKFLDRTFNLDTDRARRIMEFFLEKIEERKTMGRTPLVVHFEMVPSRFPPELREMLSRFPAGSLRLEIGIQTLNAEVSARIARPSAPEKEIEVLRFLREKTNAIVHADLIAGLPGEDINSFGRGFDKLWQALSPPSAKENSAVPPNASHFEIQLGILKLLPGTPIARHTSAFGMRYNSAPPYEVIETAALPPAELDRIKNFARFWELIVNRGLADFNTPVFNEDETSVFTKFMALSDSLLARFGRNWGIDKNELRKALEE